MLEEDWSRAYAGSHQWKDWWTAIHTGGTWPEHVQLRGSKQQFMYLDHKLCVPEDMATRLIAEWHNKLGHPGQDSTITDMRERFIVPGIFKLVPHVLKGCQLCQAVKPPNWKAKGVWHSTPVPSRPGTCISMDLVDIMQATTHAGQEVDCAVVIVDRHSGWVDAYPAKKKGLTSKTVAQLMHERWLPIMGIPQEIVTDKGPHFAAQWFKTFCALKGIVHAEAISYRSETNGRAERAIASVLGALRKIQAEKNIPWPEALPQALCSVRSAPGPTGLSPTQVVFGRDILQQGLPLPTTQEAEDAKAFHERMMQTDAFVQSELNKIHSKKEASQADLKQVTYQQGQTVWVLRPDRHEKLATWWTGPHVLIKQVGSDSWIVDVGNKHRTVHCAQMKAWHEPIVGEATPLHHHMMSEDLEDTASPDEWVVEKILNHRKRGDGTLEFLTRWQGFKPEDDTWEPASNFLQRVSVDWLKYCKHHKVDFTVMQYLQHLLLSQKV